VRTQEQIDAEVADVVRSVEADYGAALETEQNLTSSVEDAKREALALGRRALECDALERAAVSHRKLLEDLMSRSKQVGLESELKLTNLRLIERAQVPRAPSAPRSARNLTLGLLMGLLAGVGLAWLFEHMDNTLKTPEDVKVHLGVPFLGMIPELRGTQGPLIAGPGAMVDAQSAAADAYRVLRTNLMFSSAEAVGRVRARARRPPSPTWPWHWRRTARGSWPWTPTCGARRCISTSVSRRPPASRTSSWAASA
jgi:succinoglycan biosynthesis transport protein ExoP